MYLVAFLIATEPPEVEVASNRVRLGPVSDGLFTAVSFPTWLRLGIYLEAAFEPDEEGPAELALLATDPHLRSVRELYRVQLQMPPASEDWTVPRIVNHAIVLEVAVSQETDQLLWAILDDRSSICKPLVVRSQHDLPTGM